MLSNYTGVGLPLLFAGLLVPVVLPEVGVGLEHRVDLQVEGQAFEVLEVYKL